ncbi:PDR/VanB family oxidoreductase [Rhizobium paknamense]|uniref:Vanillate O-demethylase ferredoxin subunit n=1 Tax=Rhizobium paknamense TaxID=1206817 RepID=A0ABU0IC49_9HYPH|nr:PDR/VanB family oxidoreductase [Rhizobium paknamense]MDQ0455818.1 vanillate O-demethylase ferredoxin subunit [Rhizobium paknamense]
MKSKQIWRKARVISMAEPAADVRMLTFAVDGLQSAFDPGSHTNIKVMINGAPAIRTYTVIPSAPGTLSIAVKLHPNSRGGSAAIWRMQPGDETEMTEPENRFELSWRASHYLLIAGGIGVTPIYGMAEALAARGQSLRMVYGAKNRSLMAFAEPLQALLGDRLQCFSQDEGQHLDLEAEFSALPPDAEAYICGPLGLLEAARDIWRRSGRPMSRLRYEVFGDNGRFAEQEFEVEVAGYGRSITVRADQTMLDALTDAGVPMIFDCRRGECGLCAVSIVSATGEVDHRDVFFSQGERKENPRICACVSRLCGGTLVVDTGYRREQAA